MRNLKSRLIPSRKVAAVLERPTEVQRLSMGYLLAGV
jgi:hypothetical protein